MKAYLDFIVYKVQTSRKVRASILILVITVLTIYKVWDVIGMDQVSFNTLVAAILAVLSDLSII
jgi:hypothetical protein